MRSWCAKICVLLLLLLPTLGSAQTFFNFRYRDHATDCTSLTDGKLRDLCFEVDSDRLFKCQPSVGDCDTAAEWRLVTTVPAGSDTQVQFNDGGVFGGDGGLTYNKSTDVLTAIGGFVGNLTGNITGNAATVTTNANLTGHVTSVGNAAVLGSFTSLQLRTALTDETGTGAAVFATTPTFATSALFPAGSVGAPGLAAAGDTDTGIWFPSADIMAISTGGVEALRIDALQRVMIGVTSTTSRLEVLQTGNGESGVRVSASAGGLGVPTFDFANSTQLWSYRIQGNSSHQYILRDGTNSIEKFVMFPTTTGLAYFANIANFGFRDATPDAQIDVVNATASQPIARFEHASTPTADYVQIGTNASTTGDILAVDSSGRLCLNKATCTAIIGVNGNVGQTWQMERHTTGNTAGNDLVVMGGGATVGATDKNGGRLQLKPGTATGNGSALIEFYNVKSLQGAGTTDRVATLAARILNDHLEHVGIAPGVSACGTSPSISAEATDHGGKVTIGTGGVAASCTLTFAKAFTNAPACFCTNESQILLCRAVSTTTTIVLGAAVAFGASNVVSYGCVASN